MLWCMPGNRERSTRQCGRGEGRQRAGMGHTHSWRHPKERLCSFGLPCTMNVLRRALPCEHAPRLQFSHLLLQTLASCPSMRNRDQVCRTRARAAAGPQACPKVLRPLFVATEISGWCARDRTRDQISGHAEVSCLWSEAIKS